MWRRRLRRLLVGLLVIAVIATAAFVVVRPVRVSVLSVALVPELLNQGPRPLSAFTPTPRRESITYGAEVRDRMDLYLPGTSPADLSTPARYPTVMLVLGVNPLPLDDARVVRTATAIARLGVVVAAPESDRLRNWRLDPGEAPHLVEAFEAVAARPEVDPDRIGMAAFSVGAAIALIAASDPRIAERVRWINAFGGFGDAEALLVESATRRIVVDGVERPWKMGELAREMFLRTVARLASDEAEGERIAGEVEAIVLGDGPTPETFDPSFAASLTGADSQAAYRLATSVDRATAAAAVAALSPEKHAVLRGISPNEAVAGLRAPIYLMHDTGDTAIPFSQFEPLALAVPRSLIRRVTPFTFFDHVQPGASLGPSALAEVGKLQAHLNDVLNVVL
jgi:hypothetical protein